MSGWKFVTRTGSDFLAAVQFLTRIPTPYLPYDSNSLSRAVKFFPVVGLVIGSAAALLHQLITPHLPRLVTALLVIAFLVSITGCLHEDGLADTADGFGGGSSREQVLAILKDSRIGSYGGVALTLSLLARVLLLASLPLTQIPQYLIAAHVLCRWTTTSLRPAVCKIRLEPVREHESPSSPHAEHSLLAPSSALRSVRLHWCARQGALTWRCKSSTHPARGSVS